MKQPKINEATRNLLFSADTEKVLSAIQTLKETGNKAYLPLLFDLLVTHPETEVKKAILDLLATVKDKEAIPVIIEALQNQKYRSIRKELTTSCWQSGLDYSAYFEVFIDLIIHEEWEVAFEAFTVIENLEHFPPEGQFREIKLKIAGALRNVNEQKQYFLEEILKMSSE